jgi:hypothetical protein
MLIAVEEQLSVKVVQACTSLASQQNKPVSISKHVVTGPPGIFEVMKYDSLLRELALSA